jgi:hypothetical protein
MKIRMLTGLSGPDISLAPGDLHECVAAEAKRLIAAGFAEGVSSAPAREKAVARQRGKEVRG